jgi:2,3-diketo-5-methylthiopentyl-1-phosphate enolase
MSPFNPLLFAIPETVNPDDYVIGTYIVKAETPDYMQFAAHLAVEESTGSWIHLPLETPELVSRHGAKVVKVFQVPDHEYATSDKEITFVVEIAFPFLNFGHQLPMLMNTLIGVISFFGHIKLVDIHFPRKYVEQFPGPRFGVEQIRQQLGVHDRPLVGGIIKPCVGLTPQQAGDLFLQMALGGADMVKDDEKTANASYSTVVQRVKVCLAAERRSFEQTGHHTYYAVNITDTPKNILANARAALDAGANMLMVSHLTSGLGAIQDLASSEINLPINVHPDFLGAYSKSPYLGMSSHLSLGKLPRLCGADISADPAPYGMELDTPQKYFKTLVALQAPFYDLKPTFAQIGGGVHPGTAKVIIDDLGNDILLTAGGAVHAHPLGPQAGVKALRQAVDAVLAGRDLREASRELKELGAAIDAWGIYGEQHPA